MGNLEKNLLKVLPLSANPDLRFKLLYWNPPIITLLNRKFLRIIGTGIINYEIPEV